MVRLHLVIRSYRKEGPMATQVRETRQKDALAGWSLPAWTYRDPEFFALELDRVFRPSWQVVCHESDVPAAGDWHTLDYCGESVIVARGNEIGRASCRERVGQSV